MFGEKQKIFICHAWENKNFVRQLEDKIRTTDSDVWVDHSDVRGGDRISKRVSDALEWCNTLLLVWSRPASTSKWVELEWNAAVNLQKTIIPCLLDHTKLPAILTGMAYIDFRNFDDGIEQLWYALSFSLTDERRKKQSKQRKKDRTPDTIRILFLAANPKDTSPLRLDEEIRSIDHALRQAEFRDRFDIKQHWAVRVSDLQSYFLRYKPDIVHFSGHGSASNEIILEDNDGNSQSVSNRALTQLFSVLKENIQCVILNACYSEQQAQAIAKSIDYVIGMSKAIGDSAAISFAMAFYQALGFGKDIRKAFDLGCLQIDLEKLGEQDTPKLLAINSDTKKISFVNEPLTFENLRANQPKEVDYDSKSTRKLRTNIGLSISLFLAIALYFIYRLATNPGTTHETAPPIVPGPDTTRVSQGGSSSIHGNSSIGEPKSKPKKDDTSKNKEETIPPDPPMDTISATEVEQMIKNRDFYANVNNSGGKGIAHKYQAKLIRDVLVVIDEATQLMWQQSGSRSSLLYAEARDYIHDLKKRKYAGHNDWHLPSLEQALALLEPEKKNGDLNISSEFDRHQNIIWTSTKKNESKIWAVSFSEGLYEDVPADQVRRFVRAVCTISDTISANE